MDFDSDDFSLAYAATDQRTGQGTVTIRRRGDQPLVADLSRFEQRENPDGALFYGAHTHDPCVSKALTGLPLRTARPAGYHGQVEAHPYAVAAGGDGDWYVAELFSGQISVVSPAGQGRELR